MSQPPIADRLGRYRLLSRLAVGGMAELFLAEQEGAEGFRKRVVIKRLLPQLARKGPVVEMFLNEARLVSAIEHPNVVQILDLGQDGDAYFIAMEFLDGRSLSEIEETAQGRSQLVPLALAARILADASGGLDWAHNATDAEGRPLGIVHRDFTPANLFVTFDGRVKVLDFGIAKSEAVPSQTEPGSLKGKYVYMSPEMIAGRPVDRRADLFAAGVMLYELTTGRLPFVGNSVRAVLSSIALARPIPPRQLDPTIPVELENLALQLLARNPEERPHSAEAVKLALEAYLEDQGLVVGPAQVGQYLNDLFPQRGEEMRNLAAPLASRAGTKSWPSLVPAPRASRRSPWPGAVAAAALLALAAVGGGLVWQRPGSRRALLGQGSAPAVHKAAEGAAPAAPLAVPSPPGGPDVAAAESSDDLAAARKALADGKPEAAQGAAERALRQTPQSAAGHALLGLALLGQRYGARAETEIQEAVRLAPADPETYAALATLKTATGDLSSAVVAREKVAALAPLDLANLAALAKLYAAKGDWKRELSSLDLLYQRTGEKPEVLAEAGFARYQLGDDKKAEADLQRALKLEPHQPRALYALGFVRYKQGKTPEAIAAYRAAAAADRRSTEALGALADLYTAENQPGAAAAVYQEILQRDPQDGNAKAHLAARR